MRTKTLVTVLIWSAGSFGLSMALLLPGSLHADDPAAVSAVVAEPTSIQTDHFDLALKMPDVKNASIGPFARLDVDPGAPPKMKLEAKNRTQVMLTVPVKIQFMSTPRASRMSRVPLPAKETWSYDRTLTLKPGATESVEIVSDAKLEAGSSIMISMTSGEKTVYPMTMSVKATK